MEDSANKNDTTSAASFCDNSSQQEISKEEQELRELVVPDVRDLPVTPPSAVDSNFVRYFAPDFMKPGHDQYVYRHANGLCVIGLAPTHVALKEKGVTAVDFNVGKSDRSEIKVTGKRKKDVGLAALGLNFVRQDMKNFAIVQNAQHFEANTALCKVCTNDASYIVRCCVKGSLLEVNNRLLEKPGLLNSSADREGYIAIIMPKPTDWLKGKNSLLSLEDYRKLREIC